MAKGNVYGLHSHEKKLYFLNGDVSVVVLLGFYPFIIFNQKFAK